MAESTEGQNKFRERLSLVADFLSLSEFVRQWIWNSFIGSVVVAAITAVLKWLGVPLWQVVVIIFGTVATFVLIIRGSRPSSPSTSELGPSDSIAQPLLLLGGISTIKVSWVVTLFSVAVFAYSLYLQSQLQEIQSQLQGIHSQLGGVRADLNCYALPRRVTPDQKAAITAYLKKYDPSDITLRLPVADGEAMLYAADFEQALSAGDWRVKYDMSPVPPNGPFPERGVSLSDKSNQNTRNAYSERRGRGPPHPGEVILKALEGLWNTCRCNGDDPTLGDGVYKIELTIGPRPASCG